jgi:hypothetical protein
MAPAAAATTTTTTTTMAAGLAPEALAERAKEEMEETAAGRVSHVRQEVYTATGDC